MNATTPIDLRSDTVTRPSPAMRSAIAAAAVGDDQYGDDPTVNALQERVAALLGKEAALWLPSGTMANQVALRTLTRPGDDVIVSREAHAVWHETGGSAANAGVQLTEIGARGVFTAEEFLAAIKPRDHAIYPPTTLVEVENTHNRAGGVVFPQDEAVRICASARKLGIASYLDGARLWNVAAATGTSLSELAAPFDLVGVSLSKGLGAPGGSLLAGSRDIVARANRHRRMLGGAMRQVGIFAAAGIFALDNNMTRLVEDHANARLIAERLATVPAYCHRSCNGADEHPRVRPRPGRTGCHGARCQCARTRRADQCLWTAHGPRSHAPRRIARPMYEGCRRPGRDCQRLDG